MTLVSRAYVGRNSSWPVMNFAHFHLDPKRINNPRPDFLSEFVSRFDPALKAELGALLGAEDQRLRRSLNRLVELRNAIAHGSNEDMVAGQALALSNVACEIGDWFILAFNPDRRYGTNSGSGVRK